MKAGATRQRAWAPKRRWTDAERAELKRRWRGRITPAIIAHFGRTAAAIRDVARRMGIARPKAIARRNHFTRWSRADDAKLTEMWGHYGEREIRAALGRTIESIYRRVYVLGLESQPEIGRGTPVRVAADHLGLSSCGLWSVLGECGIVPQRRALCSRVRTAKARHHVVELDAVEALYLCRETRTTTRTGWMRAEGEPSAVRAARARVRAVFAVVPVRSRVPVGVLGEVFHDVRGPWTVAWEAACAAWKETAHCAPWLLTLAAYDLAHEESKAAREWTEWIPQQPLGQAKELAKILAPKRAKRRRRQGPTLVRAAGATCRDGRAEVPAAPTSTGTSPDLERRSA